MLFRSTGLPSAGCWHQLLSVSIYSLYKIYHPSIRETIILYLSLHYAMKRSTTADSDSCPSLTLCSELSMQFRCKRCHCESNNDVYCARNFYIAEHLLVRSYHGAERGILTLRTSQLLERQTDVVLELRATE